MLLVFLFQLLSAIVHCYGKDDDRMEKRAMRNGKDVVKDDRDFFVYIVAAIDPWYKNGHAPRGCGGTLIHRDFVVTSYSCVPTQYKELLMAIAVYTGDFRNETTLQSGTDLSFQVVRNIHYFTETPSNEHDIVILELFGPLPYARKLSLCREDPYRSLVKAIGLGALDEGTYALNVRNYPHTLQEADFQLTANSYCGKEQIPEQAGCMMGNLQVCKKRLFGRESYVIDKPTNDICMCYGDSGGPVFATQEGSDTALCLHGVLQHHYSGYKLSARLRLGANRPCTGATYFARISYYKNWIYSVFNGDQPLPPVHFERALDYEPFFQNLFG